MKKYVVIGVIALFVGVGFQPVFAVENRISNDKVEKEEDCGCKEVSDIDFNRLDKTINRLEGYTRLLSILSKHNPEYEGISEETSKRVSALQGRLQEIEDYPPIILYCIILFMLFLPFWILTNIFANIPAEPDSILYDILWVLTLLCLFPAGYFYYLGAHIDCKWTEIINPFPYPDISLNNPLNPIIN